MNSTKSGIGSGKSRRGFPKAVTPDGDGGQREKVVRKNLAEEHFRVDL